MEANSRIDLQGQLKVVRKIERDLVNAGVIYPYQGRYNKNLAPEKIVMWACELKQPVSEDEIILPGQKGDWIANLNKEKEKQVAALEKDVSDVSNQGAVGNSESEISQPIASEETRLDRDSNV